MSVVDCTGRGKVPAGPHLRHAAQPVRSDSRTRGLPSEAIIRRLSRAISRPTARRVPDLRGVAHKACQFSRTAPLAAGHFIEDTYMLRSLISIVALALLLVACGKAPKPADKAAGGADGRPLLLAPEDLITVQTNALVSGPAISGSVQPETRADLRAEVSAVVLQVLKENGDSVRRGELLVRLDDSAIRESLASAEEAARAAAQSFDQAERQFQRLKTLRESGMTSTQQLEDAEIRRNNSQSDLAASKTRAAQARQQLQRTETRAPFDGIVSERKVSAGDTAQIGKELLKVIDPRSMRFEGLVSADRIDSVRLGAPVSFRVNGYGDKEFSGKVTRINPAANPTTRQVEVLVSITDGAANRVSGLYAEGRVEAGSMPALMLPQASLVRDGDKAYAWRVRDGLLQKVSLVLGERDARRGDYAVFGGLAGGDRLLRSPGASLKDGQAVQLVASAGVAAQAKPAAVPGSAAAGAVADAARGNASGSTAARATAGASAAASSPRR